MLPVKEAVKQSFRNFSELYPSETSQDVRLEEVNISESEQRWQVTLSYKNPDFEEELRAVNAASKNLFAQIGGQSAAQVHPRHFKTITLDASNGELLSVRNA